MLVKDMLRENGDLRMVGRDIKSAFDGLHRDRAAEILEKHRPLQQWVIELLRRRTIDSWVDSKLAHTTTMIAGTLQGSRLSPSLFSIYASEMVWRAARGLRQQFQEGLATLRP